MSCMRWILILGIVALALVVVPVGILLSWLAGRFLANLVGLA